MEFKQKTQYNIDDLREIMVILRGENGCPWDRKQDHHSIRKNFLEETYEVLEAIDKNDSELLCEELGDVLLQVVFHAQMEEEQNKFTFNDIANGICKKLIRRHPHIFADIKVNSAEQVLKNWDAIKKDEKKQNTYTETLENVPKVLPALMRSEKVQHRAKNAGFDYPDVNMAIADLESEIGELKAAISRNDLGNINEELGDVLFSCVNISRFFQIDSEKSLTNAIEKFITRFREVERLSMQKHVSLHSASVETLESLWGCAKQSTKEKG